MSDMGDILRKMEAASAGETAPAKTGDGSMLSILESFDNVEKGVTEGGEGPGPKFKKHLPGTHKMGKNTDTKHPASEYLVGGEEGEPDEGEEVVAEVEDEDWEDMTRRRDSEEFGYDDDEVTEETLGQKQSLSDILKSMDEANDEKLDRAKGEVQVKEKKKLVQNEKGTYDLAEGPTRQDISWYKKEIYAQLKEVTARVKTCKDVEIAREVLRELMDIEYTIGMAQDQEF